MPPVDRQRDERGPIWLVGMMGAGKSSVGRLLAERLGRRFIDLDQEMERVTGRTVAAIFASDGEAAFRAREAALALAQAEAVDAVIATGGGTACNEETMRAMRRAGLVIWLRADADEVMRRIDLSRRPLLADAGDPRAAWLELARAREERYRAADLAIDRGARTSAEVADEIAAWLDAFGPAPLAYPGALEGEQLVELGARRYPILVDERPGAEARFAAHLARRTPPGGSAIGIISDERVARLHLERYRAAMQQRGFRVTEVVVPEGERCKSLAEAGAAAEALVAGGLDRRSVVVSLGGGAVGDLAGFVASVLFRGLDVAHVPTTLLAQVDASVGGKTAVNLPAGKNLLGTFHQPLLVFADLGALATLEPRDLASGLGEIAKHALLDGGALLERLEARAEDARRGDPALLGELVAASCRIKAAVVAADERELDPRGGRMLLNLGHTVGHALEIDSHRRRAPLRHGEAVALGLVAAARVGQALGGAPGLEARVSSLLARLGLPIDLDARLEGGALAAVAVDKKRAGAGGAEGPMIRYIALERAGRAVVESLSSPRLRQLLAARPPQTIQTGGSVHDPA